MPAMKRKNQSPAMDHLAASQPRGCRDNGFRIPFGTKSWYARVSSVSNAADNPSRGNFDTLTRCGAPFSQWTGQTCLRDVVHSGDYNGSRSSVRLMYLFIVFCKELLCVSIPFWLKDFHLCVYIFRFPPSLTLFSILSQCCINCLISQFHPISSIGAPNSVSSMTPLCSYFITVRCTSERSDVMSRSIL